MEEQTQEESSEAEYAVRADPLQVALEAISESERVHAAAGYGYAALARRAQLRTLYAIAEELRLFRLKQRGAANWFAQIDMRLVDIEEALQMEVADGDQ